MNEVIYNRILELIKSILHNSREKNYGIVEDKILELRKYIKFAKTLK